MSSPSGSHLVLPVPPEPVLPVLPEPVLPEPVLPVLPEPVLPEPVLPVLPEPVLPEPVLPVLQDLTPPTKSLVLLAHFHTGMCLSEQEGMIIGIGSGIGSGHLELSHTELLGGILGRKSPGFIFSTRAATLFAYVMALRGGIFRGENDSISPVEAVLVGEVVALGEEVPLGEAMQVTGGVPVSEGVQLGEAVSEGETVSGDVETVGEGVGMGVGEGVGGVVVGGGVDGVLVASPRIDGGDDCPSTATTRRGPGLWVWAADFNLNTANLCLY
jgi:hypothetical protein